MVGKLFAQLRKHKSLLWFTAGHCWDLRKGQGCSLTGFQVPFTLYPSATSPSPMPRINTAEWFSVLSGKKTYFKKKTTRTASSEFPLVPGQKYHHLEISPYGGGLEYCWSLLWRGSGFGVTGKLSSSPAVSVQLLEFRLGEGVLWGVRESPKARTWAQCNGTHVVRKERDVLGTSPRMLLGLCQT